MNRGGSWLPRLTPRKAPIPTRATPPPAPPAALPPQPAGRVDGTRLPDAPLEPLLREHPAEQPAEGAVDPRGIRPESRLSRVALHHQHVTGRLGERSRPHGQLHRSPPFRP